MVETHGIPRLFGKRCTAVSTLKVAAFWQRRSQRDAVPCFATCQMPSEKELVENVRLLLSKGWNVIRTGFAPSPVLGIDYHHRLSVAEAAQEQTFKFREAPHLRRSDGSYTNW